VHPEYLRFDYSARKAPTREQLDEVEDLVNHQVLRDLQVDKSETSFDAARQAGAIALFGEKYGDRVRVVHVVDAEKGRTYESVELCGGTHCSRTGQIGLFKIVSDGAIAAGVRRIVAVTGKGALRWGRGKDALVRDLAGVLKAAEDELPERVGALVKERQRLEKELARSRQEAALSGIDAIRAARVDLGGGGLYAHKVDGAGADELRALADRLMAEKDAAVAILVGVTDGRAAIVVACAPAAVERGLKAGDLCRELGGALGGGGGGKPQMAQGQGKDLAALDRELARLKDSVRTRWSSGR
jgi:alanyl-tRNA synthetase